MNSLISSSPRYYETRSFLVPIILRRPLRPLGKLSNLPKTHGLWTGFELYCRAEPINSKQVEVFVSGKLFGDSAAVKKSLPSLLIYNSTPSQSGRHVRGTHETNF